jgi:anti-sigma regulatory factor (Ser/Thr protein kinase)
MNTEIPVLTAEFEQQITSTRRGARLARLLAQRQLAEWGVPYGCDFSDTVTSVVAELAANAVLHGHVPGRDFALRLELADVLRIEVSDARTERRPRTAGAALDDEGGRGLLLVGVLASRWGITERSPGKTVWAELPRPGGPVL